MAVTFYDEQSANRRNSLLLVLVVMLVFALFGFVIGYALTGDAGGALVAVVIALIIGTLSGLGSFFGGDQLVLSSSQAQEIGPQQAPQLFNVVSEMATAANVPMPRVYIINDPSPNAFATGRDPQHSSVAITTGLLQRLDREELQGVIAHEMSHVRNYDIRFTLLVGVLVGSIALLAQFFLNFTMWGGLGRSRDREEGGSGGLQIVFLVVGLIMAILAPLFGALVQMAVSRQREYLADASAVELTRNPYGLQRALAKISADPEPLKVANGATQHLYIVNPLKKLGGGSNLFSTHPPIVDRINRLRELTGEAPLDAASVRSLAGLE